MSSSSYITRPLSPQVIEGQYVDQRKLINLLRDVYGVDEGKNNFRVELRLNRYKIYPTKMIDSDKQLTEEQIQDCRTLRAR